MIDATGFYNYMYLCIVSQHTAHLLTHNVRAGSYEEPREVSVDKLNKEANETGNVSSKKKKTIPYKMSIAALYFIHQYSCLI